MVKEVRLLWQAKPGILKGDYIPEYGTCVDIVTKAALREMIHSGAAAGGRRGACRQHQGARSGGARRRPGRNHRHRFVCCHLDDIQRRRMGQCEKSTLRKEISAENIHRLTRRALQETRWVIPIRIPLVRRLTQ